MLVTATTTSITNGSFFSFICVKLCHHHISCSNNCIATIARGGAGQCRAQQHCNHTCNSNNMAHECNNNYITIITRGGRGGHCCAHQHYHHTCCKNNYFGRLGLDFFSFFCVRFCHHHISCSNNNVIARGGRRCTSVTVAVK